MINIKSLVLSFCALIFHTSILASSDKPREGAVTIRKGWKDIGYSVRNERYRYIEWVHTETKKVIGRDLFDYQIDPHETQNQAMNPDYAQVLEDMTQVLHNDTAGLKLLQESLK